MVLFVDRFRSDFFWKCCGKKAFIKRWLMILESKFRRVKVLELEEFPRGKVFFLKIDKKNQYIDILQKKIYSLGEERNNGIIISRDVYSCFNKDDISGNILDGRWIFKYLFFEVCEYILKIQKSSFEKERLTILVNEVSDVNIEIIKALSLKCKTLNVLTDNIDGFYFLEKYLNDNYGVVISVSSNFRKGALKSSIILNLDFDRECIKKCVFNRYSIIINFGESFEFLRKSFDGIFVNFYKINMPLKYVKSASFFDNFLEESMYEGFLYGRRRFEFIRNEILNDKVTIRYLIR